jgi:hypothetical protein
MDQNQEKKDVRQNIMNAIQGGRIKMRPKWHFVLKSALFILGVFIVLFLLLYFVSFTAFSVHQTGLDFAPGFGSRGWFDFIRYFPWFLVLLCIVFLGILEVLVRKFSFAYKKPLLYSALAIIALATLGGIAMAQSPFHPGFERFARRNHLPFAPDFYGHYEAQGQYDDIHRGTVIENVPGGFVMQIFYDGTSTVFITSSTQLPYENQFSPGDGVIVFGEEATSGIDAFGIRKVMEMPMMSPDSF